MFFPFAIKSSISRLEYSRLLLVISPVFCDGQTHVDLKLTGSLSICGKPSNQATEFRNQYGGHLVFRDCGPSEVDSSFGRRWFGASSAQAAHAKRPIPAI
jgi:hypothetical protein